MPVLAWRNDADGFAFVNSWTLDPIETAGLTALAQPAIWSAVGAIAAVLPFPDPFLLTAAGVAANVAIGTVAPTVGIGLCGGMAYASLDYWHARAPLPRGAHANDQPTRAMPAGVVLRDYIWGRLLNSLVQGGALNRTLEWSLLLNQVPSPIGGAGALRSRTASEWNKVKGFIDAGVPCPIGLVYSGRNVWDQHQILVYGYEDPGNGTGTMYVYDSNTPMQYGAADDPSCYTVTLDFTGPALVATSPSDFGDMLAGFFCTFYVPLPPLAALATSFGQFVSWPGDPSSYITAYGARMPIAGAAELAALGGTTGDVRAAAAAPTTAPRPRDNALLRERSSAPVFLYAGGSPFQVPDPTWLDRFGGTRAVRVVSDGSLAAFAGLPDENTLLREWSAPEVYRIMGGQRRWVPSPAELATYGGFPSVRLVPDGALAAIPQGPPTSPVTAPPDSPQAFDADFYLGHYGDLAAAFGNDRVAARNHWLDYGIGEGRRGSREFDVQFYLNRYGDLRAAFGTNFRAAVDHWLTYGLSEGRRGAREFDVQFYLGSYGDLRNAFGTNYIAALNHWLYNGLNEGRRGAREFDVRFYLNRYGDLANAFGANYTAAADHWLHQGLPNEGRRGAREFDVRFYLSRYGDLTAAFGTNYISAVDHWVNQGLPNEGRAGAAEVDVAYYLGMYNDLQVAFGANYQSAVDHWIAQGLPNEGRRASSTFDVQFYLATYADLQAAFGAAGYTAAFDHWLIYGIAEGRSGAP